MTTSALPKTLGPGFLRVLKDSSKALQKAKKVDPRDRYVVLFPNAESAYVGMAFKLLTVKPAEDVFDQASQLIKRDLLKMCLSGPAPDLLDSMENRYTATYVMSHATMAKLAYEKPEVVPLCKAAGGIGIGFINSLVLSHAMSFEDGLDLVQRQGKAMDRASKVIPSAKLKVRFAPATSKRRVCAAAIEHCHQLGIPPEVAICSITKQSHAHLVEIAGHEEAIKYLETEGVRLFKFRLVARVKRLPLAINTELMAPVKEYLRMYIDQRMKDNPSYLVDPETCSVYSSTAGRRLRGVRAIRKDLIQHPCKSVQVEQLLHCMFRRPSCLAQPNIFVLWDRNLLANLEFVNRPAHEAAKLFE